MSSDRDHELNLVEVNRLVAYGLTLSTAVEVANGSRDEAFEIARAIERKKVISWCQGRKNIPHALTAIWDLKPEHFYLAFDGEHPETHDSDDFALISADVDDVNCKLTNAASRDKGPWHRQFKGKSCGIAYRWIHGNGVTPPLLGEYQSQIHIVGGMHRFHLAKHYGTRRMPFLVQTTEVAKLLALLPTGNLS